MAAGDEERHIEVPLNARRTADVEAACWAGEWQVNGEAAMAAGDEDRHLDVPLKGRTGNVLEWEQQLLLRIIAAAAEGGRASNVTYWNGTSKCSCG